jgi:hypothetical protein
MGYGPLPRRQSACANGAANLASPRRPAFHTPREDLLETDTKACYLYGIVLALNGAIVLREITKWLNRFRHMPIRALSAAVGFDYKNAPNQTVFSRPIAATVSSYTMTVTSPPTPTDLYIGTVISDSGNVLPPATLIDSWRTGTGGTGTYGLSNSGTVTSAETVTAVTGGVGSTGVNGFGWMAFDTIGNVAQGI